VIIVQGQLRIYSHDILCYRESPAAQYHTKKDIDEVLLSLTHEPLGEHDERRQLADNFLKICAAIQMNYGNICCHLSPMQIAYSQRKKHYLRNLKHLVGFLMSFSLNVFFSYIKKSDDRPCFYSFVDTFSERKKGLRKVFCHILFGIVLTQAVYFHYMSG